MLEIANGGAVSYSANSFAFNASGAVTITGTGLTFKKQTAGTDGTVSTSTIDLSSGTSGTNTTYAAGTGITITDSTISVNESALTSVTTNTASIATINSAILSLKTIINNEAARKLNIVVSEFTSTTTKKITSGDYVYIGATIDLQYVTQNMHFIKAASTSGITLSDYDIVDVNTDFGITDSSAQVLRLLNANNTSLVSAISAGTLFTYFTSGTPSIAVADTAGTGKVIYTDGPTIKSNYIA